MMQILVLALSFAPAMAVRAVRDVPLGECYDCEVTCFEDCAFKFDREIITPDATGFMQQSNATTNHTNRVHFGWRSAQSTTKQDTKKAIEMADEYAACLKQDKCHGHPVSLKSKNKVNSQACAAVSSKSLSLLEKKRRCSVNDPSCAQKCAEKVANSDTVVLAQGKKDFPLHPVKINVFAKGTINLDFCLKSCLAVTCGCADAAGYTDAASVAKQVKANDAAGEPVKDLPPADHYKKATLAECAKGIYGKKVNSGMYINYGGGWQEVCSDEFLSTTYGIDADITEPKKKCASPLADDVKFGCIWDNQSEMCVYGDQTIGKCFVKYHDDFKF